MVGDFSLFMAIFALEASGFDVWMGVWGFHPTKRVPFLPTHSCADQHLHFITAYWSRAVGHDTRVLLRSSY